MHAHTYSMTMASVKVNIEKHAFQLFGRMWDVWEPGWSMWPIVVGKASRKDKDASLGCWSPHRAAAGVSVPVCGSRSTWMTCHRQPHRNLRVQWCLQDG